MRKSLFSLSFLASLALASCSTILNNLPGVYSIDIQQGNIIDQAMVDQLRPNMNKRQVLYIMGSPMLVDAFHPQRWDYIYFNQPGGNEKVQKRVSLFFENEQVIAIQGDLKPSAKPIIKTTQETIVEVPKRDIEKTLWEKITGLVGGSDDEEIAKKQPARANPDIIDSQY